MAAEHEKSLIFLVDVVKNLPYIIDHLTHFAENLVCMIDEYVQRVLSLSYRATELQSIARSCQQDVHQMTQCAFMYVESVNDFFYYAGGKVNIGKIKEELLVNNNFEPLIEFLGMLEYYLSKTERNFLEFKEVCNKLETTNCIKAVEECKKKAKEANAMKQAAKVVGGTAAATAIAGGVGTGVTLSIVAGVFTFGIGTVIGLGATAVGAAAAGLTVGTGTAVATHCVASHFDEARKAFSDLTSDFQRLLDSGYETNRTCLTIRTNLRTLSGKIDDIKHQRQQNHTKQIICNELDLLCRKLNYFSKTTSNCRNRIAGQRHTNISVVQSLTS